MRSPDEITGEITQTEQHLADLKTEHARAVLPDYPKWVTPADGAPRIVATAAEEDQLLHPPEPATAHTPESLPPVVELPLRAEAPTTTRRRTP